MSVQLIVLYVEGMTCPACESRISRSLQSVAGVRGAKAFLRGGKVAIEIEDRLVDRRSLELAIADAGYSVRRSAKAGPRSGTGAALGIGLLLVAAYLAASSSGVFAALPVIDASFGYAMLSVAGLLTSLHCVAMCGGIALSQSVRPGQVEGRTGSPAGAFERLEPGLHYNAGRVFSYTVMGGIIGALGAAFSFSPLAKGIIAAAAGLFMVALGLRMFGILDGSLGLDKLVPSPLRNALSKASTALRGRGPFVVGALNGLMPCGPLQTMQLYALGSGGAIAGAFSMLAFSLGTVPLMLLFGATAVLLPRRIVPIMAKASAVLVLFLGVATVGRAAALAGIAAPDVSAPALVAGRPSSSGRKALAATLSGGVQSVVTEFTGGDYVPFTVRAGVPLRWTIRIKAEDLNGCNNPLVVPAYGIEKELAAGDNIVEFTPQEAGTIAYSCWMGMIRSSITVANGNG